MKKFEIGKSTDNQKFNAWFSQCSSEQIPYIIVKNRTKYSTIEWDYISLKPEVDKLLDYYGDSNKSKFFEIFRKYANKNSEYMMSNVVLYAKNIPIESAPKFAEELFDVIYSQIN